MLLFDINVLVYSHRPDMDQHPVFREYVESTLDGPESVAIPDVVLSGFLRIVTNGRVFSNPTPLPVAFEAAHELTGRSTPVAGLSPRGWQYFKRVCTELHLAGPDISDAYLGALAFDNEATLVSADSDFAKFPNLSVLNPSEGT